MHIVRFTLREAEDTLALASASSLNQKAPENAKEQLPLIKFVSKKSREWQTSNLAVLFILMAE
jgi:hypothetical protein